MKIITQAFSNSDFVSPDFAIITIDDKLKEKINKAAIIINEHYPTEYISLKFPAFNFNFYVEEVDKVVKNYTLPLIISNWLQTIKKEDDIIIIPNEIEKDLPTADCVLDTYMITIYKDYFILTAYGKYDSSIEFYSSSISIKLLNGYDHNSN